MLADILGCGRWAVSRVHLAQEDVNSKVIDGEAVHCRADGVSDFDALHSRRFDAVETLYAFDLLELDGEDRWRRTLLERKAMLQGLLQRAPAGVAYNDHTDAPGADVFRLACQMGLEGIVSKRADLPYRSGRSKATVLCRALAAPRFA
jgi:bifunctional non-homologous end joining protein LigD